eukprot:gene7376-9060_t
MSKLIVYFCLVLILGIFVESISAALTLTSLGPIPNRYPATDKTKKATQAAIAGLKYEKIYSPTARTIVECTPDARGVRIDMQGTFNSGGVKYYNLQAQVCGVSGSSTVAHVNVADTTASRNPAHQKGVERKVRDALNKSFNDKLSYRMNGSLD